MKIEQGSNLTRAKVTNQSAIRRLIYLYGPITRTEISKRLNLTLPTITNNVNMMLENGTIREQEEKVTIIKGSAGRKSGLLEIAKDSNYFIGVDILRKERNAAIVDFKGKSIYSIKDTTFYGTYEGLLECVTTIIQSLFEANIVPKEKIAGIGLCIPGIIDSENGVIKRNKQWGFDNKPFVDDLRSRLQFDGLMVLENDAVARAIRYNMENKKNLRECGLFAYVLWRDGISCPIMLNDQSLVAKALGPGELSYSILEGSRPIDESFHTGRLSELAGLRAIIQRMYEVEVNEIKTIQDAGQQVDPNIIIQLQREGNETVNGIVDKALTYLGYAISNVQNLLHPECFVLEGKLFANEENKERLLAVCKQPQLRPDSTEPVLQFIDSSLFTAAEAAGFVVIQEKLGEYEE